MNKITDIKEKRLLFGKSCFYILSYIFVFVLSGLLITKTITAGLDIKETSSLSWIRQFDVFLILFLLIDFIVINRVLSKNRLKYQKSFFWILIGLIFVIIFWGIAKNAYPEQEIYSFNNLAYFGILVLGVISLVTKEARRIFEPLKIRLEKEKKLLKYIFLITLLIVVLAQILSSFPQNEVINSILEIYNLFKGLLFFFAIFAGALTFYFNREKIDTELEQEKTTEGLAEEKRKKEFPQKFPRLNKIPILRNIVKWMHKEGWWYSSIIIMLIIIGFGIRLYHLGELSLWWDEFVVMEQTNNILTYGIPGNPLTHGYYWRGAVYHYLVIPFIKLFGTNEFGYRFLGVLAGVGIIITTYLILKKINKKIAIAAALFITFSPMSVEMSRFARFYILNAFFFTLAIIFTYKGFYKNNTVWKFFGIILFILMVHTVQVGQFFVFIVGTFYFQHLIKLIKDKNRIKIIKNNISNYILGIVCVLIAVNGNILSKIFCQFKEKVPSKLTDLVTPATTLKFRMPDFYSLKFMGEQYHILPIILIGICLALIYILLNSNTKNNNKKYIAYLILSTVFLLIGYEILNQGVHSVRFLSFLEPFIMFIFFITILFLLKIFKLKSYLIIIITMIILLTLNPSFINTITVQYGQDLTNYPYKFAHVIAYRSDFKTQYEYLNKIILPNDTLITIFCYDDYSKYPSDYIFQQNDISKTQRVYNYSIKNKRIYINSLNEIKKIVENKNNTRIWLVVNGAHWNILATKHLRNDFKRFVEINKNLVKYNSPDGYSKVLLINDATFE